MLDPLYDLTFDPTNDIDVGFSKSKFEIGIFQDGMGSDCFEVYVEMNRKSM